MKKVIFGFILGFMLAIGVTAFAAVELNVVPNPFPVYINGDLSQVEAYNINNSTYFKLTDLKPAGIANEFVDKKIFITSAVPTVASTKEASSMDETAEKISSTPDGITTIDTWEGKQYIGVLYIRNKIKEKDYGFVVNTKTKQWQVIKGTEVILDNIPTTMLTGYGYSGVTTDYYINSILPLIK